MQNQIDIATITDIKELKALAYDQLALKERAEQNISAINKRIMEVAKAEAEAKKGPAELTAGQDANAAGSNEEQGADANVDSTPGTDSQES